MANLPKNYFDQYGFTNTSELGMELVCQDGVPRVETTCENRVAMKIDRNCETLRFFTSTVDPDVNCIPALEANPNAVFLYAQSEIKVAVLHNQTILNGPVVIDGDLFVENGHLHAGLKLEIDEIDVLGDANIGGDLHVGKDLTVDGEIIGGFNPTDLHLSGSLEVDGNSIMHGNLTVEGNIVGNLTFYDLEVENDAHVGGDLRVDGNIFGIPAITDLYVPGWLTVDGEARFNGLVILTETLNTQTIEANVIDTISLIVSTTATVSGQITGGTVYSTGNVSADGQLTALSGLDATGQSYVRGPLDVLANTFIDGDLEVTGTITGNLIFENLEVSGYANIGGKLTVFGGFEFSGTGIIHNQTTFNSFVYVGDRLIVTASGIDVTGSSIFHNDTEVEGFFTASKLIATTAGLDVSGASILRSTVTIMNSLTVTVGGFDVTDNCFIDGDLETTGKIKCASLEVPNLDIPGYVNVGGKLTVLGGFDLSGAGFIRNGLESNDRIMITSGGIDVEGPSFFDGGFNAFGVSEFEGAVNIDGAVTVTLNVGAGSFTTAGQGAFGNLLVSGLSVLGGKLTVTGGGLDISGVSIFKERVTVTTNGIDITGTAQLRSSAVVTGTISSTGSITVSSGGAHVTGNSQFITGGGINLFTVTGHSYLDGDLEVTGYITGKFIELIVDGTLTVGGLTTLNGGLNVTAGATNIAAGLNVTGGGFQATGHGVFHDTLNVEDKLTVTSGGLEVTGIGTFNSHLQANSTFTVENVFIARVGSSLVGPVVAGSTLQTGGTLTVSAGGMAVYGLATALHTSLGVDGTAAIGSTLSAGGQLTVSAGGMNISGTSTIYGQTTISNYPLIVSGASGTLNVAGSTTLGGTASVGNKLTVLAGGLDISGESIFRGGVTFLSPVTFTDLDITNDLGVGGWILCNQSITAGWHLYQTSAAHTLDVTGVSHLRNLVNIYNNTWIGGNLVVTGTVSGNLQPTFGMTVPGKLIANSCIEVNGTCTSSINTPLNVYGTLTVSSGGLSVTSGLAVFSNGIGVLAGGATIAGLTTCSAGLDVGAGGADITGTTIVRGNLDVTGTITGDFNITSVPGNFSVGGKLTVSQCVDIYGSCTSYIRTPLIATKTVDVGGKLTVSDCLVVNGTTCTSSINTALYVGGNTTVDADLTVEDDTRIKGNLVVDGTITGEGAGGGSSSLVVGAMQKNSGSVTNSAGVVITSYATPTNNDSSMCNSGAGTITIKKSGFYLVSVDCILKKQSTGSTGGSFQIYIDIDSESAARKLPVWDRDANATPMRANAVRTLYMATGRVVKVLLASPASGSTLTYEALQFSCVGLNV